MLRHASGWPLLIGLYAGLLAWLTWPLALHLTTHLPKTDILCLYDLPYAAWVLAYDTHTLLSAPGSLANANIYHPAPDALFYGPTAFGALPLFVPPFLLTGNTTLAINLTLLGGVTLTALGLHAVVQRWTGSHLAGFVAAATLLGGRWALWSWLPTAPFYAAMMYFPWIIYLSARPASRLAPALALVPLVVLQSLTDPVFVAAAVFAPLGLLAILRVARAATRAAGLRLLAALIVAGALLLPVYRMYMRVSAANPDLVRQSVWYRPPSNPPPEGGALLAFFGDVAVFPLWLPRGVVGVGNFSGVSRAAALVIVAGALSVLVWRRHPRWSQGWRQAAYWVVAGLLVAVPAVSWFGGEPFRMPQFLLLEWLAPTALRLYRGIWRVGVGCWLGLYLLVGVAFAECAVRLRGGRRRRLWRMAPLALAVLVVGLTYGEYRRSVPHQYPLMEMPALRPETLHALAERPGPLLELPIGSDGLDKRQHAIAMYRSTVHWHRILNGYSSYWPAGFAERMSVALRLPDAEAVATLRRETGLATILVRTEDLPPPARQAWLALPESGRDDLRLVATDGAELLFEVRESAAYRLIN